MKRNYKWSPFEFIKNKSSGNMPTENDLNCFNNYLTAVILSSSPKYRSLARYLNLKSFTKLDKAHQCMAYNSFNGHSIYGKYVGVKKSIKYLNDETIQKVMYVLECNALKAKAYIEDGRIDIEEVISYYNDVHNIYD